MERSLTCFCTPLGREIPSKKKRATVLKQKDLGKKGAVFFLAVKAQETKSRGKHHSFPERKKTREVSLLLKSGLENPTREKKILAKGYARFSSR